MSCLHLNIECQNGKTKLTDSYFTQPFKVAKPFEEENGMSIMVMTATAGILQGDSYDIQVIAGDRTKTVITNQSYTKIFNTREGEASQTVKLQVQGRGELAWMMQPVIPFHNSAFTTMTEVTLSERAAFCFLDVLSCGRVAMGERFAFRKYHGRVVVKDENGKPLYLDNVRMYPKNQDYSGLGYFEGYTHMGSIYLYGYQEPVLKQADGVLAAVTEAKGGYVVRLMGNSADRLYRYGVDVYQNLQRSEKSKNRNKSQ